MQIPEVAPEKSKTPIRRWLAGWGFLFETRARHNAKIAVGKLLEPLADDIGVGRGFAPVAASGVFTGVFAISKTTLAGECARRSLYNSVKRK